MPCQMNQNSSPQYSVFSTADSRNSELEDSTGKKNFNNPTFDHNAKLAFVSAFEDNKKSHNFQFPDGGWECAKC